MPAMLRSSMSRSMSRAGVSMSSLLAPIAAILLSNLVEVISVRRSMRPDPARRHGPVLPLLAPNGVSRPRKGAGAPEIDTARVPPGVVGVEVRAQDEVDLLGMVAGGGKRFEVGPAFHVVTGLVRPVLVIAAAR